MPILVRVSMLGCARPLSVPSKGHDGGEVMCLSSVVWLRHGGGVGVDPGLSVQPGSPGLAGPQSFGPSLTDVLWAARPAN
jgi:hypothetical protein